MKASETTERWQQIVTNNVCLSLGGQTVVCSAKLPHNYDGIYVNDVSNKNIYLFANAIRSNSDEVVIWLVGHYG